MTLKTTPTIDRLNKVVAAQNVAGIDRLVQSMWTKPDQYSHLDFMAIGRAHVVSDGLLVGSYPTEMPGERLKERSPQKYLSQRMGMIAACVEKDALTRDERPYEFLAPGTKGSLVPDFLAEVWGIAKAHPDAEVKKMAKWALKHLGARHVQEIGLG